ncbi:MAG: hypothetical protein B7X35_05235 [Halothiobacillus sp. 14-56-357]|uniref:ATP-grasp domain-containing protein n=1 Tax=Halothiobacillus sp. 15-55-196 TaxID=1970382 RepID=UPI000BC9A20C|nr:hypothetical protein [Halothiobacillus sp. 15-55-196]OZB37191.1 MAG: hypothetical protein B7X44_02935 [Halothiobacillus sp. 15-55-196]OZB56525.1 MAG: hypothetical protein B7X35_05235 [Halothiobacillus sp. 14-56-357]OZB77922.1 MAG: hypothetical protein B7X29_06855 [Halothiobacillus sp. 13-55-115]
MTEEDHVDIPSTPFLGLAPFLRASIEGQDLQAFARAALGNLNQFPLDANLWMNLSTLMFSLGQRESAFATQNQGLTLQRSFEIPALTQPSSFRILMLMVPGDIAANTPLDCLLEGSDIDLFCHYCALDALLPDPLPPHDAVFIAIGDAPQHRPLLTALATALNDWPVRVLNRPQAIPNTQRDTACQILHDIPGVLMPTTYRISREQLAAVAETSQPLTHIAADLDFPLIVRPFDSHAGRDLERVANIAALQRYLDQVSSTEFFIAPFIDYSGADGLFRKFRIALVGGKPFAVHMAVSAHWMIHYVNAGMYEDTEKRQEEAQFMLHFDAFITRHGQALGMIAERMGLDYVCFDGAETQAGELLIFEIDHVMVVHAMDPVELFPYKQEPIQQIQNALRQLLATTTAETE